MRSAPVRPGQGQTPQRIAAKRERDDRGHRMAINWRRSPGSKPDIKLALHRHLRSHAIMSIPTAPQGPQRSPSRRPGMQATSRTLRPHLPLASRRPAHSHHHRNLSTDRCRVDDHRRRAASLPTHGKRSRCPSASCIPTPPRLRTALHGSQIGASPTDPSPRPEPHPSDSVGPTSGLRRCPRGHGEPLRVASPLAPPRPLLQRS